MINFTLIGQKSAFFIKNYEYGGIKNYLNDNDLIQICPFQFGTDAHSIRALIHKSNRCATIVYNEYIPYILSHEIGHYLLDHTSVSTCCMTDQSFSYLSEDTMTARQENEANYFAAEIMLNDKEVIQYIQTNNLEKASALLCCPIEFLDFKLRYMSQKRIITYNSSLGIRSNFLKDATFSEYDEWDGC